MYERLKPWNRKTAPCQVCGNLADVAITCSALESTDRYLTLVCADHEDEVIDPLVDEHGGASSQPVRDPWPVWFRLRTPWGRVWDWWNAHLEAHMIGPNAVERAYPLRWVWCSDENWDGDPVMVTGVSFTRRGAESDLQAANRELGLTSR